MWMHNQPITLVAMNSGQKWYYEEWGELLGPVDGEEMCDMVQLGVVMARTQVWRDGMVGRHPIATVPELAEHLPEPELLNPQGTGQPLVPIYVPTSTAAVASLVLGIISLSLFCLWPVSILCGFIGLAFGLSANRGAHWQPMATAGIVTSLIGLSSSALVFFFTMIAG